MENNPKLIANRKRARRKANAVLAVSLVALAVPALLFAGVDLAGVLYPASAAAGNGPATAEQPAGPVVGLGSVVSLEVVGTLDNGSVFVVGDPLEVTIGDGVLVPGLEEALMGLAAGDTFDVTVDPVFGYGDYNERDVDTLPVNVARDRTYRTDTDDVDEHYGPLSIGQVVPTKRWPAKILGFSGEKVILEYQPTVGETVSLYRYYDSTVVGFNDTEIYLRNEVYVGLSYTKIDRESREATTYWVTEVTATTFTVDSNPPLAGQTLHFKGKLLDVGAGTGVAPPPAGPVVGTALSITSDNCQRCHGGFAAMDSLISVTKSNGTLSVDVSVENPWNHDLQSVTVEATLSAGGSTRERASDALPNLAAGEVSGTAFAIPMPPENGTLSVVVNATVTHTHKSGGKPNSLPYQLTVAVPVSAASGQGAESIQVGNTVAPFQRDTIDDPWALVGRAFGFVSLGLCAVAAFQGGKRHVRLPPWFKAPPWVTTHFLIAVAAILMSVGHGIILMSGMYRGLWSLDIVVGVIGLALLGWLGFSGIFLAKWMKSKVPWVRKLHFWLMSTMVGAGVVHVVVSSTTLHDLIGY
jgi:FKBP-type peptidyl-prolyl cis-trans isomerase 2